LDTLIGIVSGYGIVTGGKIHEIVEDKNDFILLEKKGRHGFPVA